jgi:hypothetical protein
MQPPDESYQEKLPEVPLERAGPGEESPPRDFEELYAAIERPGYKLHSPGDAALATFLGSPLAGCIVLAINYFKLGRSLAGWQAILLGLLASIALVTLGVKMPAHSPGFLVAVVSLIATYGLAKALQGSIYENHLSEGGEKASGWIAAGIGIACLGVLFAGIVAWFVVDYQYFTTRVRFGPDEEVIYADGATEAEAQKLGKLLQDERYFNGVGGKTVRITRDGNRAVVDFVVQENAWLDLEIVKSFEQLKPRLSQEIFDGRPVQIRLIDESMEVRKTI